MKADRRTFVAGLAGLALARPVLAAAPRPRAVTVRGPVDLSDLRITLVHEHVLVDFVGAAEVGRHRYDADEAFRVVLPHLRALKERGARTPRPGAGRGTVRIGGVVGAGLCAYRD